MNVTSYLKYSVVATLAVAFFCTGQVCAENDKNYLLATASTGGTYYPVGVALSTLTKVKLQPGHNITVIDDADVKLLDVLKEGGLPFLLPIGALIGMLVYGFTPTYAAGISILAVIAASWLTPNKMGITAILEALALGARNMIMTGILLCSVGLMVNVIATTGIGNTFSLMITQWASGSLLIAIALIALASLVLGMGLPVTAAYIVLGTLSAPALYNLIVDSQLTDIIAKGMLSEEAKTIFMLALPEKVAALSQAMPVDEARAMLKAVPLDLIGTVRDLAITPHAATFALLVGAYDHFLAQPGQQCHPAGMSCRLHCRCHCQDPANADRPLFLETGERALYRAHPFCLYADAGWQLDR